MADFFAAEHWQRVTSRHGWVFSMIEPLVIVVEMTATGGRGLADRYTLRLACEYYPTNPPDVIFVNPVTLEYEYGKDNRFVAKLEADYCRTHLNYQYNPPYKYGPQLVCSSMTLGYYVSKHNPTPNQVWVPGRHDIGSTLDAIQRAMRSSHYKGRHE